MTFIPASDGHWVSERFMRLSEIIQDYDPQFELRWIPPESRENPEDVSKCFVIWDLVTNTPVLFAGELDDPAQVLGRLFDSDNKQGDVLKRLEAHNAAVEAFKLKEQIEEREEKKEKAAWLMETKKNYINMGNGRVVDDQLREIRRGV